MRDRRTAIVLAIATLSCLAFTVFSSRNQLVETWWIWMLQARDFEARKTSAKRRGERGSDRAVQALIKNLETEDGLGDSAVQALAQIHPRAGPKARADILRCLLRLLPVAEKAEDRRRLPRGAKGPPKAPSGPEERRRREPLHDREIVQSLCTLKVEKAEEIDVLLAGLGKSSEGKLEALTTLLFNWKSAETAVARHLSSLEPDAVQGFFRAVESLCQPEDKPSWWHQKPGIWPGTTLQKIGNNLAVACEKPEARAIALSHSIFGKGLDGKPCSSTQALKALAREDTSPLVRKAAIRMAGFLGSVEDNLDLAGLLFEEKDPAILTEAIEARSLQAFPFAISTPDTFAVARYSRLGLRLELWDGFLCDWLRKCTRRRKACRALS